MKNKIRIGITMRIVQAPNYNEERDALSHDWNRFSELTNITLIHLPNLSDIISYVEELDLDGIILSGGDNIGDTPIRDDTENKIMNYCFSNQIPLFGVCRGMQIINTFFDGKLGKDKTENHVNIPHSIEIVNSECISTNEKLVTVNSFHQNIIEFSSLGNDLDVFAISKNDNSVEGFVHKSLPIMGVMWHPEREPNSFNQNLITHFFSHSDSKK